MPTTTEQQQGGNQGKASHTCLKKEWFRRVLALGLKRKETHMTPGLSCPNPDTHPLLRDPPPLPSALPTATKATQAGFLAESWFFLLWSHTLLWESRSLPKSWPPCWV